MDQVPNLLPSYWTRRRQIQVDVAAFFHDSSDHVVLSEYCSCVATLRAITAVYVHFIRPKL